MISEGFKRKHERRLALAHFVVCLVPPNLTCLLAKRGTLSEFKVMITYDVKAIFTMLRLFVLVG